MHAALAAKALGKWVHVGRINTPVRYERWKDVADSCDGSGLARYDHMLESIFEGLPLLDGEAVRYRKAVT